MTPHTCNLQVQRNQTVSPITIIRTGAGKESVANKIAFVKQAIKEYTGGTKHSTQNIIPMRTPTGSGREAPQQAPTNLDFVSTLRQQTLITIRGQVLTVSNVATIVFILYHEVTLRR